jgi:hypothetical protein
VVDRLLDRDEHRVKAVQAFRRVFPCEGLSLDPPMGSG